MTNWLPILVALAALLVLSARSALVLGRRSPWTRAGWWCSAAYAVTAAAHPYVPAVGPIVEYAPLGLLAVAFAVAGVRDEPQAEPWWWPRGSGATGAERRARRS